MSVIKPLGPHEGAPAVRDAKLHNIRDLVSDRMSMSLINGGVAMRRFVRTTIERYFI